MLRVIYEMVSSLSRSTDMSFALRFERSRGLVVCHVGVTAQPPFPCYHSVQRVEGLLCPLRSRDNYYFLFSSVEKRVSSSTDVGVIRPLRGWYPHIVGYVIEREAAPSTSSNTQPCVFFIHLLHPSLCPRLASYLPRATTERSSGRRKAASSTPSSAYCM